MSGSIYKRAWQDEKNFSDDDFYVSFLPHGALGDGNLPNQIRLGAGDSSPFDRD